MVAIIQKSQNNPNFPKLKSLANIISKQDFKEPLKYAIIKILSWYTLPLLVIEMRYNGSLPTKLHSDSNFVSIKRQMVQNRSCCQLGKKGSSTSRPIWALIHLAGLLVFYFLLSVLQINLEIGLKIGLPLNRNFSATTNVCFPFLFLFLSSSSAYSFSFFVVFIFMFIHSHL